MGGESVQVADTRFRRFLTEQVDARTRSVVAAVAVLGDDAIAPHLAVVAGVRRAALEQVLADLVEEAVLRCDGVIRFARPEYEAEALSAVDPSELQVLRARSARALFDAGEPEDVVAGHLLNSAPIREPWVVDVLRTVAARSRRSGDQHGAIELLRRCLLERPPTRVRVETLLDLAGTEARVSADNAIIHYREVLPLLDVPARRIDVRLRLARVLGATRRLHEGIDEVELARTEATDEHDRLRIELTFIALARQSLDTRPWARTRIDGLRGSISDGTATGRGLIGELAYEQGLAGVPVADVLVNAMMAMGGEELSGIHDLLGPTRQVVLLTLCWCGELRTAERAARALITRATGRGALVDIGVGHTILFNVAWRRGAMEQAAAEAEAYLSTARNGPDAMLPASSGFKAAALAELGRQDEALAALELPGGHDEWAATASYHGYLIGRARTMLSLGRPDDAYRSAVQCGTLANAMGTINPSVLPWRSLAAEAAAELGMADVATPLADEELHLARRFGAHGAIAIALRAAAVTRPRAERRAFLEEAAAVVARTPDRLTAARIDRDLRDLDAPVDRTAAPPPIDLDAGVRPAPAIRIRALGDFSVVDRDAREITPSGVAAKAIRVVVAAARPLHIEELGDRLWEDELDREQTRSRLRNVISRTRTAIGPVLVRRGDLVSLADDVVVDADEFDRAARAVLAGAAAPDSVDRAVSVTLMYTGDLLPTDPFSDWAALRREELRLKYLTVADAAFALAAEAGLINVAIEVAESAIRYDPYDEERYRRAGALLERTGRPSQAAAMYKRADNARRALGR